MNAVKITEFHISQWGWHRDALSLCKYNSIYLHESHIFVCLDHSCVLHLHVGICFACSHRENTFDMSVN